MDGFEQTNGLNIKYYSVPLQSFSVHLFTPENTFKVKFALYTSWSILLLYCTKKKTMTFSLEEL